MLAAVEIEMHETRASRSGRVFVFGDCKRVKWHDKYYVYAVSN